VLTAERPSTARRRRQGCGSRPTDATTRRSSPAPESEGRSSSKARRSRSSHLGMIYWGEARRRWRRLEAEMTKPHVQDEARNETEQNRHRAAADLAGAHRSQARSSSAIRNRQRGLRLELDREGRRVRGRLAGPSWSDQAHSGGLTSGPRLSAQPF
jgi:hypothetical protein